MDTKNPITFVHNSPYDKLQIVKMQTCHLIKVVIKVIIKVARFFFCMAGIFHDIGFKVLRMSNTSTIKIGINLCHNLPRGNCGTKLCHFQRYWHYSSFVFVVNDIAYVTENSIQVLKSFFFFYLWSGYLKVNCTLLIK